MLHILNWMSIFFLKSYSNTFLYWYCFIWLFPKQKDTKKREQLKKKKDTCKYQYSIWKEGQKNKKKAKKPQRSNSEWTQVWLKPSPQVCQLHTDVIHLFCCTPPPYPYLKEKLGSCGIKYIYSTTKVILKSNFIYVRDAKEKLLYLLFPFSICPNPRSLDTDNIQLC